MDFDPGVQIVDLGPDPDDQCSALQRAFPISHSDDGLNELAEGPQKRTNPDGRVEVGGLVREIRRHVPQQARLKCTRHRCDRRANPIRARLFARPPRIAPAAAKANG